MKFGERPYTYHPPTYFSDEEERSFLRAFDGGLAVLDEKAGCTLPTLRRIPRPPTQVSSLFGKKGRLEDAFYVTWREYLFQIGCAAKAIFDLGWPADHVGLDPGDQTYDLGLYESASESAAMVVAVEVKKTGKELARLLAEIEPLIGTVVGPRFRVRQRSDRNKYYALIDERPSWFWAICPQRSVCFRVVVTADAAFLVPAGSEPPAFVGAATDP